MKKFLNELEKKIGSVPAVDMTLLKDALEVEVEEGDLLRYVTDEYFEGDINKALQEYIDDVNGQTELTYDFQSYIAGLEKNLKATVNKEIKKSVANNIDKNVKDSIESFIRENYGEIKRKITIDVTVGKKKTQLNEVVHKQFEDCLCFLTKNISPMLVGPAGSGKNILCKQLAKSLGVDFYMSNAVSQEYKLTGFVDASGFYHKTPFYDAFTKGGLFMLDEVDASIPDVLVMLNACLANGDFDFPVGKDENGNQVGGLLQAHKDFKVIAAANTFGLGADIEYVGRNQLDAATLDRFQPVVIDYDREIEMSIAEGDAELVDFIHEVRKSASDAGMHLIVSYRGLDRLVKYKSCFPLSKALNLAIVRHMPKDDINILLSNIRKDSIYKKALQELCK